MASFQAIIGWKRMRNREIKIFVPFCSYPTHDRKFQKNSKKIQKINKYHYGFISSQTRLEKDEEERNKNYRSVRTRRVIENSKKITKKLKKLINTIISSQTRLEKDEEERNKNYRSVPFLPDA